MTDTKVAIRVGLGVVCGLALVLLPLVFSAPTANFAASPRTSTTNSTNPNWFPVGGIGHLNSTAAQPPQFLPLSGINMSVFGTLPSFLIIITFIFLPSAIFSLVVRRWAEKKARDYL